MVFLYIKKITRKIEKCPLLKVPTKTNCYHKTFYSKTPTQLLLKIIHFTECILSY